MKTSLRFASAALAAALATTSAQADTLGMPALDSSFALWDTNFTTNSFPSLAPQSNGGAFGNISLSNVLAGGIGPAQEAHGGSGDKGIYNGAGPNSTPYNFLFSGSALSFIPTLTLTLKFIDPPGPLGYSNFFSPLLNGAAPTTTTVLTSAIDGTSNGTGNPQTGFGFQYGVTQFTWSNVNIAPGSNYTLTAPTGPDTTSASISLVDTIQVGAVPEPNAVMLLGGAAFLLLLRRRMWRAA